MRSLRNWKRKEERKHPHKLTKVYYKEKGYTYKKEVLPKLSIVGEKLKLKKEKLPKLESPRLKGIPLKKTPELKKLFRK